MTITLSITSAGIPWSAAELARITPDPEAPLCSVQQQLEALGYRVTAIQGSGMEVSAEVDRVAVTGETITDEQLRELRMDVATTLEERRLCAVALDEFGARTKREREAARRRLAPVWKRLRGAAS